MVSGKGEAAVGREKMPGWTVIRDGDLGGVWAEELERGKISYFEQERR